MNIYEKAKKEYELGNITINELAIKYNCSRQCMARNLKKLNVDIKRAGRTQEEISKLELAREMHVNGATLKEISLKINMSVPSISRYIKEKDGKILTDKCNRIDKNKLTLNENYFETIDTEDKAYWLGFIMADGCIRHYPSYALTIELSIIDILHLKKFRRDIESTHAIRKRKGKEMCSITVYSKKLIEDLMKLGCVPNKTEEGFISDDILNLSTDLKAHFLRGYLDGDGYIDKKRNRVIYTIKSLKITNQLNILLKEVSGILFKIKNNDTYYRLYREDKNNFINIINKLYCNSTIFLNRKYAIYKDRVSPFQDESLEIISAELSGELLENLYEPNGNILC